MTQEEKVRLLAEKVMGWKYCESLRLTLDDSEVIPHCFSMSGSWACVQAHRNSYEIWNPFVNDADCLQVLRQFPAWDAGGDSIDTYFNLEGNGRKEHSFIVHSRNEPDPAQRFRTAICEAAIKTIGRKECL